MIRRVGVGVLVVSGLFLAGCDKLVELGIVKTKESTGEASADDASANYAKVEKKPLAVKWTDRTGTLEGGAETIEVLGLKTTYSITLKGFTKGTRYEVKGQSGAVDSDSYDMVSVEVKERLGALELDQLKSVDLGLELSLELPDGRAGKTRLAPVYFDYGLREVLLAAENGPVLFGNEPPDATTDNCLIWPSGSELEKYGVCTTLQTIDWIAVDHELPEEKGKKVCSGYKDDKPSPDLTVVSKDTEVTIYDRRTGKIIDKKTFAPDAKCPMFAMTSKADEHQMDAYPDRAAIQAWLRTKPKR